MLKTIKRFTAKSQFPEREKVMRWKPMISGHIPTTCQPGNLMLDLDEHIFSELIKNIDLQNKTVADIGCGTGRHWQKIYAKNPAQVMGFDVSAGMLHQLLRKFPAAVTQLTTDNLLKTVPDSSCGLSYYYPYNRPH